MTDDADDDSDRAERRADGDRSAGRGHAFENTYRGLLLARLEHADRLTLYAERGEDALVETAAGLRCVHQVKSGEGSGTMKALKSAFADAEETLTQLGADTFTLVTEEALTKTARAALEAAKASAWGAGRLAHARFPTQDEARRQARETLERRYLDLARERLDAPVADMNALTAALIDEELRLAGGRSRGDVSITGREVAQRIGIDRKVREWKAAATRGLQSWDQWLASARPAPPRAGQPAETATAKGQWALALDAPWAVSTVAELDAREAVGAWLQDGAPGSVFVVHGRSGTGKTWLLARLAAHVQDELGLETYVYDETSAETPRLATLRGLADGPVVVFVDDLRDDRLRTLLNAARETSGVLVVAGSGVVRLRDEELALPRDVDALLSIVSQERVQRFGLPTIARSEDRRAIAARVPGGLSRGLTDETRGYNLRRLASRLDRRAPITDPEQLSRVHRSRDGAAWMELLLVASTVPVRIPWSLLQRTVGEARAAVGVEHALLQRRGTDGHRWVWLEEQASAAALSNRSVDDDPRTPEAIRFDAVNRLLSHVDPERADDRVFARQLLRRAARRTARELVELHGDLLVDIVEREAAVDIAYSWLGILNAADASVAAERAARSCTPPRSAADVIILATALGTFETAELILANIPAGWEREPWEDVFAASDALPRAVKNSVARLLVKAAAAGAVDPEFLMRSGRAQRGFAGMVAERGTPEFRRASAAIGVEMLGERHAPIGILPEIYSLVERSVTGARSELSLRMVSAAAALEEPGAALESELSAEFDALAASQRHDRHVDTALQTSLELARSLTERGEDNRASVVWSRHASFARRWSAHDLGGFTEAAALAERMDTEGQASPAASSLFLASTRGIVDRASEHGDWKQLTPADVGTALRWFSTPRRGISDAVAFLWFVLGLTRSGDEQVATSAAWYLRRSAVGPDDRVKRARSDLARAVANWTGERRPLLAPVPLFHLRKDCHERVLTEYLVVCRGASIVGGVPPFALQQLVYDRPPQVHAHAFNAMFRWDREKPQFDLLETQLRLAGDRDDRPESVVRRVAFEAARGDRPAARALLRRMVELEQEGRGAHLRTAHRAILAVAHLESPSRERLLRLAGRLLLTRPLDVTDDAFIAPVRAEDAA